MCVSMLLACSHRCQYTSQRTVCHDGSCTMMPVNASITTTRTNKRHSPSSTPNTMMSKARSMISPLDKYPMHAGDDPKENNSGLVPVHILGVRQYLEVLAPTLGFGEGDAKAMFTRRMIRQDHTTSKSASQYGHHIHRHIGASASVLAPRARPA